MGDITTLAKAASNSTTLRTSIPSSVKNQFNLTEKDKLEWVFFGKADGSVGIEVIPKKTPF